MTNKKIFQMIGLLQPKFYRDGDMWCFRYGTDIASGVCGFGETPFRAAVEFCNNFMWEKIPLKSDPSLPVPAP